MEPIGQFGYFAAGINCNNRAIVVRFTAFSGSVKLLSHIYIWVILK